MQLFYNILLLICLRQATYFSDLTCTLVTCIAAPLHGFAFWFDVEFGGPANVTTANGDSHNDKLPIIV